MSERQHTKDRLADELDKAGLPDMAAKAREGLYHDFLSPLTFPDLQLDEDLAAAVRAGNPHAGALRQRHHAGDFDASAEESEAWAESDEGQDAFRRLVEKR